MSCRGMLDVEVIFGPGTLFCSVSVLAVSVSEFEAVCHEYSVELFPWQRCTSRFYIESLQPNLCNRISANNAADPWFQLAIERFQAWRRLHTALSKSPFRHEAESISPSSRGVGMSKKMIALAARYPHLRHRVGLESQS